MPRRLFRTLTVVIVLSAFLNGSAPSAVYAKSAPMCLSGIGMATGLFPAYNAQSGSFQVQVGDVVVATITEGVSGPADTERATIAASTGPLTNFNNGPSVSVTWIATFANAPATVMGAFTSAAQPFRWQVSLNGGCAPGTGLLLNFNDGRCNQEPWQAFAVYPDGKGGYYFYAIYQGEGYYAMHVTENMLDENPDTGVNHLIAQSQGTQLWRLAGGALQAVRNGLNDKLYSFIIGTCGAAED